jgi:predicted nucleic acid-binding protein
VIIVDTNVISESLKPRCSEAVTAWLDAQVAESLFLTSVNAAELWAGVALMPDGVRKKTLEASLDDLIERLFGQRLLSFDFKAARAYADLTRRGKPLPLADGLIAAIAQVEGFAVATRDEGPFREAGVKVINPWEYAG